MKYQYVQNRTVCTIIFCEIRDILGEQALFSWWHGKGGLLDYTNADALEWWHQQMDQVNKEVVYEY